MAPEGWYVRTLRGLVLAVLELPPDRSSAGRACALPRRGCRRGTGSIPTFSVGNATPGRAGASTEARVVDRGVRSCRGPYPSRWGSSCRGDDGAVDHGWRVVPVGAGVPTLVRPGQGSVMTRIGVDRLPATVIEPSGKEVRWIRAKYTDSQVGERKESAHAACARAVGCSPARTRWRSSRVKRHSKGVATVL
jgi:hypothetical protein